MSYNLLVVWGLKQPFFERNN